MIFWLAPQISFEARFLRGRIALRSDQKDEAEHWLREACALSLGFSASYQLYHVSKNWENQKKLEL